MKLPIYAYGHPIFEQKCKNINALTPEIEKLIRDMKETMWLLKCESLAAIQVGFPINLCVIERVKNKKQVFVNAEITHTEGFLNTAMESDVSFPNLSVGVDRPSTITLSYQNENLEKLTETVSGKVCHLFFQMVEYAQGKTMMDSIHKLRQKSLGRYLHHIRSGKVMPDYEMIFASKVDKTST